MEGRGAKRLLPFITEVFRKMNNPEFNYSYNNIIMKVAKKTFKEISEKDKRDYNIFLFDLQSAHGVKPNIKRNFDSNIYNVVKARFL